MKRFRFSKQKRVLFSFSKPKMVILESVLSRKKRNDHVMIRKEDGWLFFGGGKTKVRGLNLRMVKTFS